MGIFKVWVINLDSAVSRLESVRNQLKELPLEWIRFAAVRGSLMSSEEVKQHLNLRLFKLKHGKTPVSGELGCYQSHLKVLQGFLNSTDLFAVIVEDDVQFFAPFLKTVQQLINHPHDWDLVKLSGVHSGTPIKIRPICNQVDLAVPLTQYTGASAYLVNRKAAQLLVNQISVMSLPYDHAFDRDWELGFKLRMTKPAVCGHGIGDESTINYYDVHNPRLSNLKRVPAVMFRLCSEISRLLFRSFDALKSKVVYAISEKFTLRP